jgi:phosphoribosylaminoimidazole (AIR) synthetase
MGVGMIVVVSPRDADAAMAALPSVFKLGTVQAEEGVRYVNA